MKNLFFLTVFSFLSLAVLAQEKQFIKQDDISTRNERQIDSNNGALRSWIPLTTNFVSTDINGNHHDLQAYLDQGKPVVIDVSATWCGPCWGLHQSHILRVLHNTYGPGGSDELVVLFVEAWASNTGAQITGTSTSQNKSGFTHGDWTDGGTVPYPIIDDAAINNVLDYNYFPSLFVICPNGVYKDITNNININGNALSEATKIRNIVTTCPSLKPLFGISAPKMEVQNTPVFVSAAFAIGEDSNLSYAWTFEGGTPASSTTSAPSVIWSEVGEYKITVEITNEFGTSTRTRNIIITEPISSFTFDLDSYPDFIVDDFAPATTYDGDGLKSFGAPGAEYENKYYRGSFMVFNPTATTPPLTQNAFVANSGTKYFVCFAANAGPGNPKVANNDWLITPKVSLKNNSKFSFYAKSLSEEFAPERFNVLISTTNNKPESFVKLSLAASESSRIGNESEELDYTEAPSQWTNYEYDLSEYNNTPVYLAIQCVSLDKYMFMVDDIEVSSIENSLSVSTDKYVFNVTGGEKNIDIQSNVDWTVSGPGVDWLTVSHTSGSKNGTISLVATAYEGTENRTASITISGAYGVAPKTIEIIQSATQIEYELNVNHTELSFSAAEEDKTLEIKSNVDWSITKDADWLEISSLNGEGNKDVVVTVSKNESSEDRTAKITITGDNNVESKIVSVKQLKGNTFISYEQLSDLQIYPNPARNMLNILNAEGACLTISNSLGLVLSEIKSISDNQEVDVSKYDAGSYFIRLTKGSEILYRKIIIVK